MNHMKMPAAQFLQSQRHSGQRPHKRRVHHRAIGQIDHELAVAAVHHFPRELLEISAIEEASLAFDLHPHGWTVHPYLNRRFHNWSIKNTRSTVGLSNSPATSTGRD